MQSNDARCDDWFVTAVLTTRLYCRPSCAVRTPLARNVRFVPTVATAQRAGIRACERCRPEASPDSAEWNVHGDVVVRTMRLIVDGTVDREGVGGLAARLGYSTRQLERLLEAEVGAGPLALARAQRAQTARLLIETTDLPFGEVALAAGFSSIRQFNDIVRSVFDGTPTGPRKRASTQRGSPPSGVESPGAAPLRLPARTPFAHQGVSCAVPGCEEVRDGAYRRTLRLPGGGGLLTLRPAADHVHCVLVLDDFRGLTTGGHPVSSSPKPRRRYRSGHRRVDRRPAPWRGGGRGSRATDPSNGRRGRTRRAGGAGPTCIDRAARTHSGRLVSAYGQQIRDPGGALTHTFPSIEQLADIDPVYLRVPAARWRTASRRGRPSRRRRSRPERQQRLDSLPPTVAGIARRRAAHRGGIAMRGLANPDAPAAGDLGFRLAASRVGLPHRQPARAGHSLRGRPWRSYATQYLWSALKRPVNHWPSTEAAA